MHLPKKNTLGESNNVRNIFLNELHSLFAMNKKRLLVFASTFPRWLGDTNPPFVFELSKRLTSQFEVHVLTPSYPGAKKNEVMEACHVHRFHYFIPAFEKLAGSGGILPILKKNKFNWFLVPFFLIGSFFAFASLYRLIKPSSVHAHWIIPQGLVVAVYKTLFGMKARFVITSHGGDIFGLKKLNFLKKWVLSKADHLTVVSNAIKKEVSTLKVNVPTSVIPMGVDSEKFHPSKRDLSLKKKYGIKGPFLLFVGRLTEKKGVRYLISAMPAVVKKHPLAKLLIVGSGELEKELKELTASLRMNDHIVFVGAVVNAQLPVFYATADVFVAPSIIASNGDREGFGLVFVEAGMSGCTVVASDTPAVKDIFGEKYSYYSNTASLSAVILKALSKPISVDLKRFDWRVISRRYIGELL